jgi:hypothetical protein
VLCFRLLRHINNNRNGYKIKHNLHPCEYLIPLKVFIVFDTCVLPNTDGAALEPTTLSLEVPPFLGRRATIAGEREVTPFSGR